MTLREARRAAGLSQAALAEKLHVDQSAVSLWESGDHPPLKKYRARLARLCGVAEEELFRGEGAPARGRKAPVRRRR